MGTSAVGSPGLELDSGPIGVAPPVRRRLVHRRLVHRGRWLIATVVVLALLAIGDWGLRVREMASLVAAVESSERSMVATNDALHEVLLLWQDQSTIAPTVTTAAVLAERTRNALDSLHKRTAVGESSMIVHGADLRGLQIVPWHRSLREAQEEYVAHVDAWLDYYSALRRDFSGYGQPQARINGTFDVAGTSLRRAVPDPDPFGFGARVEKVFED